MLYIEKTKLMLMTGLKKNLKIDKYIYLKKGR